MFEGLKNLIAEKFSQLDRSSDSAYYTRTDSFENTYSTYPFQKFKNHFMGNRWGNSGNSVRLYFAGAPKSLQMVTAAMKLKDAYSLEEKL